MDKLRALQYFVAAAEERSFSGAARRLEVSVPAIAKLITSLERNLGAALFDRTAHGLTLTADGYGYLETCQPLLEQLAAADEVVSGAAARPRGTLVIGAPPFLAQHCILPALPRFHARYPDIQLDIRIVHRPADADAGAVDVFVLLGWPEHPDLVHRRIGRTRFLVCAAPAYWAAHGIPQRPKDLERHVCLLFRGPEGTVLDLWQYERGEEKESAAVKGWLISNHRDVILDAVIAGEGIARMSDLTIRTHLHAGRLVPVLLDWETKDAPPINLLYRPSHRRTPRVRLFIEFVTDLFRRLEAEREDRFTSQLAAERPSWYGRRYGRASAAGRELR
jgi:LysR family transcriptional regulator for bpeEF and oprC